MWTHYRIFVGGFILAAVVTPLMMLIARKLEVLDHPRERGMHKKATPLLGGVAMYLAFVAALLLSMDYSEQLKGVLIGSTLIFFAGLLDDLFHLRASIKLLFQIAACVVLMEHGVILQVLRYQSLNVLCTFLGVIGITNATNFLDNMDGLAAGLVAICSFIFFSIAVVTGQHWLGYLGIALSASCCGFLLYNFKPAKIFMGDCGASFIGFALASLAVLGQWSYSVITAITVPVLVLGVFIFDMFMITVLRIKSKKVRNFRQWLEYAGKDHLSHRLHQMGFTDKQAVLMVYTICSFLGLLAWEVHRRENLLFSIGAIAFYVVLLTVGTFVLDKTSHRHSSRSAETQETQTVVKKN